MNIVLRANPSAPTLGYALVREYQTTLEALQSICGKPSTLQLQMRITGVLNEVGVSGCAGQDDRTAAEV